MKRMFGWIGIMASGVCIFVCAAPGEAITEAEKLALQDSSGRGEWIAVEEAPVVAALPAPVDYTGLVGGDADAPIYPIDLLTAVSLAGAKDLEIDFMRQRLRQAYAQEKYASVQYLPDVSIFSEFFKHEGRIQGTVGDLPVVSKQSLFSGVGLFWVYDFSHQWYEILAQRQVRSGREAELEATRQTRMHGAAIRFFDLVGARARHEVAEESVRRGRALVGFEQSLLDSGKGLEADVARAEAFRAEQEQGLAGTTAEREISSTVLATQLRLDPQLLLEPVEGAVVPLRLVDRGPGKTDLIAMALSQRPEIQSARRFRSAEETRREMVARKRFLPTIAGEARVGGFAGDDGSGLEEFDDRQDYLLSISWTTDNLGKGDRALLDQQQALLGQASVREEQIADQVTQEVLVAWSGVRAAEEKMELAREQVEAASASLSLTNSRLRNGLAIPYEVIQAEEALVRARTNQVNTIVEFNKAELSLLRSLGGFDGLLAEN